MARSVFEVLVAASFGTVAMTAPAWAHHSFAAAFDADKPVTVRGVIVEAKLANPHSWINVTAEDPKVLTGPWTAPTVKLVRAPFEHVMETSCENTETARLMEAAAKDNYGRKP